MLNRLTDKIQQPGCALRSVHTVVHCIVIIIFVLFLFLKAYLWPTEVMEGASDQPFSYQKYYFKPLKTINRIILTHYFKVRFMESMALERPWRFYYC